jgi:hypothetical protein
MIRTGTIVVFFLAAGLRAEPPDAKPQLRDYLPTLLLKTQLETTRDYVGSLESLFKLAESLSDTGLVSLAQVRQVEREMLQAKIDASKLEREHLDSADQFQAKTELKPERIRELEDSAIGPLLRQVRKFEEVCGELDSLGKEISKFDDPDSAHKLRGALGRIVSSSPGFRDTRFRSDFALRSAYWHRQSERELAQLMREKAEDRRKLLSDKIHVEDMGRKLSPESQRLLSKSEFELALGRLEIALRRYESEPWKDRDAPGPRAAELFRSVAVAFGTVMLWGYGERLEQLRAGWPQISPMVVGKVDLLDSERERAEQAVAAAVKSPEAAAAAKAKLRNLRTLAETYRIGTRLIELALIQRQTDLDALRSPAVPAENGTNSDSTGPIPALLAAEKDVSREKSRLYRTWIEIQLARMDLDADLGQTR